MFLRANTTKMLRPFAYLREHGSAPFAVPRVVSRGDLGFGSGTGLGLALSEGLGKDPGKGLGINRKADLDASPSGGHPVKYISPCNTTLSGVCLDKPRDWFARRCGSVVSSLMSSRLPAVAAIFAIGLSTHDVLAADKDAYTIERFQFQAARSALADGDLETFRSLSESLVDYPIHRYLAYEALRRSISEQADAQSIALVDTFRDRYDDTALTRLLTRHLQRRLFAEDQWGLFLTVSTSDLAASLPCRELRARAETGQIDGFDEQSVKLWSDPSSIGDACRDVLATLETESKPGIVAIWERIYNAIDQNKPDLAREQAALLTRSDKNLVLGWIDATDDPQSFLTSGKLKDDTLLNRRIIRDLVWRWSKDDPVAAYEHWRSLRTVYGFKRDNRYDLDRKFGLRAAYRRLPESVAWLNAFTVKDDDLDIQEWRIRAALHDQNWDAVSAGISALPQQEQEEDHWAYWVARVKEERGDEAGARAIYTELAELQSYHGFLAADKLGTSYSLFDQAVDADNTVLATLQQNEQLIRAREYHHTGVSWEGRREWSAAVKGFDAEELKASIVLATQWDMPDRAIASAGMADERRALQHRFPVLYQPLVIDAARDNQLDPSLVYGVIRRESAFIADIKSGAGAVGLMQLMPATAKFVGKLRGDPKWRGDLTQPDTNIAFGSTYLRHVLDRYDNHLALALASYNAGPTRVKTWLPQSSTVPADIWIDTIPYSETRRYVRAVLAYSLIFEWRLLGESRRVNDLVGPVAPTES